MIDRRKVQDLVFREVVKATGEDAQLKAALGTLGFFAAVRFVDAITDGVLAGNEQNELADA